MEDEHRDKDSQEIADVRFHDINRFYKNYWSMERPPYSNYVVRTRDRECDKAIQKQAVLEK